MMNKKYIGIFVCAFALFCTLPAVTITNQVRLTQNGTIQFEGSTNDNFETILNVIDPFSDNLILLQAGSGTIAFLSDIGGGGTIGGMISLNEIPRGIGCCNIGASVMTQDCLGINVITCNNFSILGGDFLISNSGETIGVNFNDDFITGCIKQVQLANVAGTMMIYNGIASGTFPISTATNGEFVSSVMTDDGSQLIQISGRNRFRLDANNAQIELEFIRSTVAGSCNTGINFNVLDQVRIDTNGTSNILFTTSGSTFQKGDTVFPANFAMNQQGDLGGQIKINATFVAKNRCWERPCMDGTMAMWAEEATEDLTVDNTSVTCGALTCATTYVFTVGANSSWDAAPNVLFDPVLPDGVAITVGTEAKAVSGTDFIPSCYGGATLTPVIPHNGNYIMITSDNSCAGLRTRAMGDGKINGQIITLEFNATCSSQFELTGILSVGGGTITFNSGMAATIKETIAIQWNACNWLEFRPLSTLIP